jgi:hypothetical protein
MHKERQLELASSLLAQACSWQATVKLPETIGMTTSSHCCLRNVQQATLLQDPMQFPK